MSSEKERTYNLNGEDPLRMNEVVRGLPAGTLEDPFYLRMVRSAASMNGARYGVQHLGGSDDDQARARQAYHVHATPGALEAMLSQANRTHERFEYGKPWLVPGTVVATADQDWAPLPCLERIPPLLRPWMLGPGHGSSKADSLQGTDDRTLSWQDHALVEHRPLSDMGHLLQPRADSKPLWDATNDETGIAVELHHASRTSGFLTLLRTGQLQVSFVAVPMTHVNALELPVLLWRVCEIPSEDHGFWDEMYGSIGMMDGSADKQIAYNGELRFVRHFQPHVEPADQRFVEWRLDVPFNVSAMRNGARLFINTQGEDANTSIRRVTTDPAGRFPRMPVDLHHQLDEELDRHAITRRETWRAETHQAVDGLEVLHQRLALDYTNTDHALDWLTPDLLTNPPQHLVDNLFYRKPATTE